MPVIGMVPHIVTDLIYRKACNTVILGTLNTDAPPTHLVETFVVVQVRCACKCSQPHALVGWHQRNAHLVSVGVRQRLYRVG